MAAEGVFCLELEFVVVRREGLETGHAQVAVGALATGLLGGYARHLNIYI
jgi:hypothetical protein